jgi:hypothetical protein
MWRLLWILFRVVETPQSAEELETLPDGRRTRE